MIEVHVRLHINYIVKPLIYLPSKQGRVWIIPVHLCFFKIDKFERFLGFFLRWVSPIKFLTSQRQHTSQSPLDRHPTCLCFDLTSIFSRIYSWDARDMSWNVTNSWPCHDMTCHVLMFQVRQSDQVTGHCTDYLLSLYTRSVTRGTMVIFDTNQVVRLSTGGGRSSTFFVNYYLYSLVTL